MDIFSSFTGDSYGIFGVTLLFVCFLGNFWYIKTWHLKILMKQKLY